MESEALSSSSRSTVSRNGTESLLESEVGAAAEAGRDDSMRFSSLTGVVASEEKARFERMVFRSTRGNCFLRFSEIEQTIMDPETNQPQKKHVFLIFFKSTAIEAKLKKICDAFSAHRYSLPEMSDDAAVSAMLQANAAELGDSHAVLTKNQDTRYRLCQLLAGHVQRWTFIVVKEKAVYHTLNMMKADVSGMLRGEGWVIASQLEAARDTVTAAHSSMDIAMPSLLEKVPQPCRSRPRTSRRTPSRTRTRSSSTRTASPATARPTPRSSPPPPSPSSSASCTGTLATGRACSPPAATSSGPTTPRASTTRCSAASCPPGTCSP